MRRIAAALLLAAVAAAHAQPPAAPVIREIAYEGNDTTRARTMERELLIRPGDPADPAAIERSRQAIQDLGLFREVTARTEEVPGGVRVTFAVKEKFFIIPAPRADTNSDGQYAYGVQLRWYNVLGYNHTAKLVLKKTNRQEAGRGTALEFDGSYFAPFIFDTPYGLDLSYSHNREPVDETPPYDQVTQSARFVVFRSFRDAGAPASRGWRLGTGLQWVNSVNDGAGAPPSDGQATTLVLDAGYSGRHFNIYSDEGQSWSMEWQGSSEKAGSDYDSSTLVAHYDGSWYVGDTPHQTIGLFAEGGIQDGGPPSQVHAFEIGGASDLRGYPHNVAGGDSYYYGGIEALRPVYWDWLRGVVFFESGNAYPDGENFAVEKSYADLGLGLRIRVTLFVKFELNIGYAWPLRPSVEGHRGRVFATGHR